MASLQISNLGFAYGPRQILSDLSFSVPRGRLTAIIGPNGCGKSTLLSCLAGLIQPSAGSISLDGQALNTFSRRQLAQRLAFLPQQPFCPPGMTVSQVLRFGRYPHQSLFRQHGPDDARILAQVSAWLQLEPLLERPMLELSGGQRQRAWLGMALAQDTDILLLDEPTSALDMGHQVEVLAAIRQAVSRGKTVVMVIHDLSAAARYGDYLVALKGGRIMAAGVPTEVLSAERIEAIFEIAVTVLPSPVDGSPIIIPTPVPHPIIAGRGSS